MTYKNALNAMPPHLLEQLKDKKNFTVDITAGDNGHSASVIFKPEGEIAAAARFKNGSEWTYRVSSEAYAQHSFLVVLFMERIAKTIVKVANEKRAAEQRQQRGALH